MISFGLKRARSKDAAFNLEIDKIISSDTPFGYKEAYRSLFTNVLYLPIESQCKKIAITSAISSEGKTTVSANLAITASLNSPESRILLIDADMRKPRLTKLLTESDDKLHGLSEFLVGIDKEPNIIKSKYAEVSIFPAGTPNVNTPGLLSSSKFVSLIGRLEEEFDYIVIDTPPVGIVSDALLLNEFIDGYIMVARADYSDIGSMSDAIDMLEGVSANFFGFVLTADNVKSNAHRKYGKYRYYSK